jgi:hypothetical protein
MVASARGPCVRLVNGVRSWGNEGRPATSRIGDTGSRAVYNIVLALNWGEVRSNTASQLPAVQRPTLAANIFSTVATLEIPGVAFAPVAASEDASVRNFRDMTTIQFPTMNPSAKSSMETAATSTGGGVATEASRSTGRTRGESTFR